MTYFKRAHLVTTSLKRCDGTGDYLLSQAKILEKKGIEVRLYASAVHENVNIKVQPYQSLCDDCDKNDLLIYHYGTYDPGFPFVIDARLKRKVFYYHNQTNPHLLAEESEIYFNVVDGLRQIQLAERNFQAYIANSPYTIDQLKVRKTLCDENWQWLPPIIKDDWDFTSPRIVDKKVNQFVYIGRILPHKRLDRALNIFQAYRKLDPNSQMIVIGGGGGVFFQHCQTLAKKIGGVIFCIDPSNEIRDSILSKSSAIFNLSAHEGFSIPVLESVSAGCLPFYGESEWLDLFLSEPSLRIGLDGDWSYAAHKIHLALTQKSDVLYRLNDKLSQYKNLMSSNYQFRCLVGNNNLA